MHARVHIPDEQILACTEFYEVLNLCLRMSGRGLQEVAWDCGWRDGGKVLSRVVRPAPRPGAARYMPGDKLVLFMAACGNDAPLRWYQLRMGSGLPGIEEQLAEIRGTLAEVREAVMRLAGDRPRYSVARQGRGGQPGLPEWLRRSVANVADVLMSATITDDSWQRV